MPAQFKSPRLRGFPLPLLFAAAAAWLSGFFALAQTPENGAQQDPGAVRVHVLPVQGNVYMLTGAGGNILLQTGKDGLVLVDTGLAEMADQTLAAIRTVSKDPIRFIINTDADRDHVGGNAAISKIANTISDNNLLPTLPVRASCRGRKLLLILPC